jgi:Lar family restriction alleviation protein
MPLEPLKPCPFCGSSSVALSPDADSEDYAWVECKECQAGGPIAQFGERPQGGADLTIEARAAWNKRRAAHLRVVPSAEPPVTDA